MDQKGGYEALVVNEKVLVREMKAGFKGWGYCVMRMDNDKWVFQTLDWVVWIDGMGNVPNEVLSLIVLHMGYLPKIQEACRIYKLDKGPAIQKEIYDAKRKEYEELMERREEYYGTPNEVNRTKLILGRRRVWQQPSDRTILMIDPAFEGIIQPKADTRIRSMGEAIYIEGDVSCVYVRKCRDNDNHQMIEHLEKLQWT